MSGIGMMLLSSGRSTPATPAGLTWVSRNAGVFGNRLWSVASSGSLRVAIGDSVVTRSVNGTTGWTNTGTTFGFIGREIVWYNNLFIVAGFDSGFQGAIATSPDGITWTTRLSGVDQITTLALAGDLLIACGLNGTIFTSADGISWTSRSSGTAVALRTATKGNSIYVIPGNSGTILTSSDGITWTSQSTGTSVNLWQAVWTGTQFIVVGDNSTVLTSASGTFWNSTQIGSGVGSLLSVAYSGNEVVAVGPVQFSQTRIFRTTDQISWATITPPSAFGTLQCVIWDTFQFITVGDDGAMFTSNS
jgi:hypothetical protein